MNKHIERARRNGKSLSSDRLHAMYEEERESHGVRASVERVATRAKLMPATVALALGFTQHFMDRRTPHAVARIAGPGDGCNCCLERNGEIITELIVGAMGIRLCDGCLPEVIRALTNPHRE